jgi:hypothetical protein
MKHDQAEIDAIESAGQALKGKRAPVSDYAEKVIKQCYATLDMALHRDEAKRAYEWMQFDKPLKRAVLNRCKFDPKRAELPLGSFNVTERASIQAAARGLMRSLTQLQLIAQGGRV